MKGIFMAILFKNTFLVHEQEVVDLVVENDIVRKKRINENTHFDQVIDLQKRIVIRGFMIHTCI
jgi:hypothetical protein